MTGALTEELFFCMFRAVDVDLSSKRDWFFPPELIEVTSFLLTSRLCSEEGLHETRTSGIRQRHAIVSKRVAGEIWNTPAEVTRGRALTHQRQSENVGLGNRSS